MSGPPNAAMNFTNDIIRVEAIDSLWFIEMHGCWVLSRSLSLSLNIFPAFFRADWGCYCFCCAFLPWKTETIASTFPPKMRWDCVMVWCGDINCYMQVIDAILLKEIRHGFRISLKAGSHFYSCHLNGTEKWFHSGNIRSNFFMWQFHLWFPSNQKWLVAACLVHGRVALPLSRRLN